GFEADHGLPFKESRGFGWQQDLSRNVRERKQVPEAYRDTFIFTRSHATWECVLPRGSYRVTVCVGDVGHEQVGQWVTVEGNTLIEDQATVSGAFHEQSTTVDVSDGRLTIDIGKTGSTTNTCLNWIVLEPAP
ncbi:MAG: hypothetical protein RLO18_29780, partial [Gimesia chilikensis]